MNARVDFFHKEFRKTRAGFPDLLRYASIIRPGIVLGKGGELITTFRYRGPDMDCASQGELNHLRLRVATMIKKLGGGWMIHSSTFRKKSQTYSGKGYFPDAVTRAIENERQRQYETEGDHYENDYYITFTYLPDAVLTSKIKEFAYDSENKDRFNSGYLVEKHIRYFERQVMTYVGELEVGLGSSLYRLTTLEKLDTATRRFVLHDEQLSYLHECITGRVQPIRVPIKTVPVGVDYIIGSYKFLTGLKPKLDDRFVAVVAIEGPPDAGTAFGMLEILNRMPVEFRWTTRWIAEDPEKAKAGFNKTRSKWRQKIRGFIADITGKQGGAINADALKMSLDAEAAMNDVESGDVAYGSWTSTVVLRAADSAYLDVAAQYLLKHVGGLGFACRLEEENATEAFLGSFPGHGYENVRQPKIHSMNLADCLPLTSTWQGPLENPCSFYKKLYDREVVPPLFTGAAKGGTPFRGVLHQGDVGHAFIGGPTGAGKSTLLGLLAASQFRYPGAKVFAFEKGESMLALCLGAGGQHYNFMEEDETGRPIASIKFAPFSRLQGIRDRTWAADYVMTIMALHDVKLDHDTKTEIRRAIESLATRPVNLRTFTNLAMEVQTREVREVLRDYESRMAGGMLNGTSDSISTGRFTVFEMEQLMEMGDVHVVPVLMYLFWMIERALDGSPVMIILDEAWLLLQHPLFQEKLKEWLKVLRKANTLVVFATQELQDVANSPIASTIFSSCQTKILLPNPEANSKENAELYRSIGLSEREVELLTYATPKREYFFKTPVGRRMFQLELGPVALAFVAASGIDERKQVKALYRQHGEDWVPHWLKVRGVDPGVLRA